AEKLQPRRGRDLLKEKPGHSAALKPKARLRTSAVFGQTRSGGHGAPDWPQGSTSKQLNLLSQMGQGANRGQQGPRHVDTPRIYFWHGDYQGLSQREFAGRADTPGIPSESGRSRDSPPGRRNRLARAASDSLARLRAAYGA